MEERRNIESDKLWLQTGAAVHQQHHSGKRLAPALEENVVVPFAMRLNHHTPTHHP